MSEIKKTEKKGARSGRPSADRDRRSLLGQIIRDRRAAAGLDQAELAVRLGFTKAAIGNWELGLTRPDIDTLPRLCEVLHVPVTELLGLPREAALPEEDKAVLDLYHCLDKYNRHTATLLMDRLLFQQDSREKARLRESWCALSLYEEAASAGIGVPMQDSSGVRTVYAPRLRIPSGADCVIRVNGTSMEPTFPGGSHVYVGSGQEVHYGQIGIFLVNGESFIKEYRPEGLFSHNHRYKTISVTESTDVRCCGRVLGLVPDGELAAGSLLEKIEAAFGETDA